MTVYQVKNFTTDWRSGIAIGALVNSHAPGLCPDWPDWIPDDALENATEAMDAAEQWLDVPQLIRPQEMIDEQVDEKSMMTYLSQFPSASLKPGALLRPRRDATKVKTYGLKPTGNYYDHPCRFTIDTNGAGRGTVEVIALNPKGAVEPCNVIANKDDPAAYTCTFTPRMNGSHRVIVKFANCEIPNSPFQINVEEAPGDPSQVQVSGLGIEADAENCVGKRTFFNVVTRKAGRGKLECTIIDPSGRRDSVIPRITQSDGNTGYLVEYTPKEPGMHQVALLFADKALPNSPYRVPISHPFQSDLAYVTGRGIQDQGIRVGESVSFMVHTEQCGHPSPLDVTITRSDGSKVPVDCEKVSDHLWKVTYKPQRPGSHDIRIRYGGVEISNKPFKVEVGADKDIPVVAFGNGLLKGRTNEANIFNVVCRGASNKITFLMKGPSEARLDCMDNDDATIRVTYWVTEPGEYALHVLYEDEDIKNSPFMPVIEKDTSDFNPEKLRIHGPGLEKMVTLGQPVEFFVENLKYAVAAPLYSTLNKSNLNNFLLANCYDNMGNVCQMRVHRRPNGTVVYGYTPTVPGNHTVEVVLGDKPAKGVPFVVTVLPEIDAKKVRIWGPGLKNGSPGEPMYFYMDAGEAIPPGTPNTVLAAYPLSVKSTDNRKRAVPVKLTQQSDGSTLFEFVPDKKANEVSIMPMLGDEPILPNPIRVSLRPLVDINKIQVLNLDSNAFVSAYIKFIVDASAIDRMGKGEVRAKVTAPGNDRFACRVLNNKDGTYTCNYTPLTTGPHQLEIEYEGMPLPGTPFPVNVRAGSDANRVTTSGPGQDLNTVLLPGQETFFIVDLTGAGQGGLRVVVEGPSNTPIECQDNQDGTCTVKYTPTVPGEYQVFVRLNEKLIPNMPVVVKCMGEKDPSQVQCYGPGLDSGYLRVGWPAYFTVDTKKAGEGELQVRYTPKPGAPMRPAEIQPLGTTGLYDSAQQHYHKVTYTPEAEGVCKLEVLYDGVHVPGSPFIVRIRKECDPDSIRVYGDGVEKSVLASLPATFTVDARGAGIGDLTLIVTDPKGQRIPVRVFPLQVDNESLVTNEVVPSVISLASGDVSETGLLSCTYEPELLGTYSIHVLFAGVEVGKKPFKVTSKATGKASACKIKSEISSIAPLGLEQIITVNTESAGKGRLTCLISHPSTEPGGPVTVLPVETEDHRNGTISVYYTPKQLGELDIELRFGGTLIPKGAFSQRIVDRTEFDHMTTVARYRPVEFRLPTGKGNMIYECTVIRPSGTQQLVSHTINNDQTITILYEPIEQGMHQMNVNYYPAMKPDNVPLSSLMKRVQGSPYRFFVDSISTGRVTAHGPGLSHGIVNKPVDFLISAKDAGGGGLFMSVEGPSNAEITSKENGDGTCSVSYLPLKHGQYAINIKFNGEDIAGSPFSAYISEDSSSHSRVYMGTQGDFSVDSFVGDVSELVASVQSPSGHEEACVLKRLPNNRLGISFTPKETGKHVINVLHGKKHIQNSPFRVRITEKEIGSPSKVKVDGSGVISGRCNQANTFTVDTREAGYSNLDLSVVGPSKAEIECCDNNDGTCTVKYIPVKEGEYAITVKYAGVNVPASPFTVTVVDEKTVVAQETYVQRREMGSISEVGSRCELSLHVPDSQARDLRAVVTAPSSQKMNCEVIPADKNHYVIKFVPHEIGEHLIGVNYKGVEIPESPFTFSVSPITDGSTQNVRATGKGLTQGYANENNEFEISTKEAGAGTLAIVIEGPSKAMVECEERGDGQSFVNYRVQKPGTYTCSIKFNDSHIKNSPFKITVADSQKGIHTQNMQQLNDLPPGQDTFKPQIGRPVKFNVHHEHQPDQVLQAVVETPADQIENAQVLQIERDEYSIRFIPRSNGPHLIYVHTVPASVASKPDLKLGPSSQYPEIPGSPFRLVINQYAGDPGLVYSSGAGLAHGIVGEENFFLVHTAGAGSGVLNMTMNGPSKVSLLTQEHVDGYVCRYIASAPGEYELNIKYGGDFHIPGSPFRVNIVGSKRHSLSLSPERPAAFGSTATRKTNAEYVRCQGLGLQHAVVDHPNYFTVDASNAGSGFPKVILCGPNRITKDVEIRPQEDNRFSVSYIVNEPGEHTLLVKWNEEHVTGSPFTVEVD